MRFKDAKQWAASLLKTAATIYQNKNSPKKRFILSKQWKHAQDGNRANGRRIHQAWQIIIFL
jgi:hypothetical protein